MKNTPKIKELEAAILNAGGGSSSQNYVQNPDAEVGTSNVLSSATGIGEWLVERTTVASELPEEPFKTTAFKISGTNLTVGDWVGWFSNTDKGPNRGINIL